MRRNSKEKIHDHRQLRFKTTLDLEEPNVEPSTELTSFGDDGASEGVFVSGRSIPLNHGSPITKEDDRVDDALLGPVGPGGGPHVRVFSSLDSSTHFEDTDRADSFAFDPDFQGGVRVSAGEVDETYLDIITAPGPGGGPHVGVFDASPASDDNYLLAVKELQDDRGMETFESVDMLFA